MQTCEEHACVASRFVLFRLGAIVGRRIARFRPYDDPAQHRHADKESHIRCLYDAAGRRHLPHLLPLDRLATRNARHKGRVHQRGTARRGWARLFLLHRAVRCGFWSTKAKCDGRLRSSFIQKNTVTFSLRFCACVGGWRWFGLVADPFHRPTPKGTSLGTTRTSSVTRQLAPRTRATLRAIHC